MRESKSRALPLGYSAILSTPYCPINHRVDVLARFKTLCYEFVDEFRREGDKDFRYE